MESPKNKDFSGELHLSKIKDFIGQNKKFIFYYFHLGKASYLAVLVCKQEQITRVIENLISFVK